MSDIHSRSERSFLAGVVTFGTRVKQSLQNSAHGASSLPQCVQNMVHGLRSSFPIHSETERPSITNRVTRSGPSSNVLISTSWNDSSTSLLCSVPNLARQFDDPLPEIAVLLQ